MKRHHQPSARLQWLGQAGFALTHRDRTIVIDPYLSDSLATKYEGTLFEHARLHPPPFDPASFRCDLVICTHQHTDHMDGATLDALTRANPDLRICVPRALTGHATAIGVSGARLIEMSAGDSFSPFEGLTITPIPAAHEQLSTDAQGEHRFLGVIASTDGVTLYHSGDSVPYEGQSDLLRDASVDVALLPVNGRDGYRLRHGVPGNFFIDEAIGLCEAADIPVLVGHHFGLFDFNTVQVDHLDRAAALSGTEVRWIRPEVGEWLQLSRGGRVASPSAR